MQTEMKRILIINRTWNYDIPKLPKLDFKTWRSAWQDYKERFSQRYLDKNNAFDFGKLDYVECMGKDSKDYILRLELDLPKGLNSSYEKERNQITETISWNYPSAIL